MRRPSLAGRAAGEAAAPSSDVKCAQVRRLERSPREPTVESTFRVSMSLRQGAGDRMCTAVPA
eukprot:7382307-Prymnesium_polylepis.1